MRRQCGGLGRCSGVCVNPRCGLGSRKQLVVGAELHGVLRRGTQSRPC